MDKKFTAVILADGKNRRFGAEKSLLLIDREPLLSNHITLLSTIFKTLMMVTSKPCLTQMYPHIFTVQDVFKNCGPLGGIHAALSSLKSDYAFVFACDMPYLNKDLIQEQCELFLQKEYDVFVPRHSQGIEPLHAIYSKQCLPAITNQLEKKIYSIRGFYHQVKTGYFEVSEKEIPSFFNINSMHDYHRSLKMKNINKRNRKMYKQNSDFPE